MCKVPARERTQENAPPKYKGAHIPSKAFSYLQYLTQNETTVSTSNTTNNSANNFSNPLPASYINAPSNLEFASVQSFDTPSESENNKNYKTNTKIISEMCFLIEKFPFKEIPFNNYL